MWSQPVVQRWIGGLPVEVPSRVLVELFGRADVHAVVVRNGVVLCAGGELNGRSTRLSNRAQRRALRDLYATCAVPGCSAASITRRVIMWCGGAAGPY